MCVRIDTHVRWACMCIQQCTWAHVHSIGAHENMYTCNSTWTHTHLCIYMCVHNPTSKHTPVYWRSHVHALAHTAHTQIYTCTHICTRTRVHTSYEYKYARAHPCNFTCCGSSEANCWERFGTITSLKMRRTEAAQRGAHRVWGEAVGRGSGATPAAVGSRREAVGRGGPREPRVCDSARFSYSVVGGSIWLMQFSGLMIRK